MLVKRTPSKAADLNTLSRLVLRFIYDEENMSIADITLMQISINKWKQAIDEAKERKAKRFLIMPWEEEWADSEQEFHLQAIGHLLYRKQNREPRLMRRIAMVKDGRLDWRKFHRLEDAYTKEDFEKAAVMKAKYDQENPEQEGLV